MFKGCCHVPAKTWSGRCFFVLKFDEPQLMGLTCGSPISVMPATTADNGRTVQGMTRTPATGTEVKAN